MNQTKIDYVDLSWNPVTGCTNELPCWSYCWAKKTAMRLRGRAGYPADEPFRITFHLDRLNEPQQIKTSKRIAVCFMGDLWHTGVKVADRAAVIRATNLAPQHTYLFLTKRIHRAAEEINWLALPNHWIGTSVANQREANERVYDLLRCKAVHRWLSVEPMQGPVEITATYGTHDALLSRIDWVIAGGGPFPVHPDDFRSVRDQCAAANVPFWFKQWGNWGPEDLRRMRSPAGRDRVFERAFDIATRHRFNDDTNVYRVGKKVAGHLLDGREWHEVPKGM
jgi:protein gp37